MTIYKCEICSAEIESYPSVKRRFCSRACKGVWMASLSGHTHWNWNDGIVSRECLICGSLFTTKRCLVALGKGKYCSDECRRIRRTHFKGPLNPNWQGGFTRESKMLWEQRRRAARSGASGDITLTDWIRILERFNYICPSCGDPEPDIMLTLDHVVPLSRGGQHVPENVQPLCRHCNAVKHTTIIAFAPYQEEVYL